MAHCPHNESRPNAPISMSDLRCIRGPVGGSFHLFFFFYSLNALLEFPVHHGVNVQFLTPLFMVLIDNSVTIDLCLLNLFKCYDQARSCNIHYE